MAPFVQRGRWSAERFIGEAERVTGSSDWGEGSFRLGLEALLASLGEVDDITPLGTAVFGSMIKQALVNRLRFIEADSPSVPLIPPLIITEDTVALFHQSLHDLLSKKTFVGQQSGKTDGRITNQHAGNEL